MARLSVRDERRAHEVVAALSAVEDGAPRAVEAALPLLRDLLETDVTCAYRMRRVGDRAEVDFVRFSGLEIPEPDAKSRFGRFLARMGEGRGLFNPIHPQPEQRNRAVVVPWRRWGVHEGPEAVSTKVAEAAPKLGLPAEQAREAAETMCALERALDEIGVHAADHVRVLLCDDDTLLAWVGALEVEPASERQRLLLRKVAQPLRERLLVEHRVHHGIGGAAVSHAAMVAALAHVPSAAFVLDAAGRVAYANEVGEQRLEREGEELGEALWEAARGKRARVNMVVTELSAPGLPAHFLVVAPMPKDRATVGARQARERWKVTAREAEVLAEIAEGRTNRDAAARLGVAERTIELHVGSLLRKARAESRSQLIVKLWELCDAC